MPNFLPYNSEKITTLTKFPQSLSKKELIYCSVYLLTCIRSHAECIIAEWEAYLVPYLNIYEKIYFIIIETEKAIFCTSWRTSIRERNDNRDFRNSLIALSEELERCHQPGDIIQNLQSLSFLINIFKNSNVNLQEVNEYLKGLKDAHIFYLFEIIETCKEADLSDIDDQFSKKY